MTLCGTRNGSDALDLNQLPLVPQPRYSQQCAGRPMWRQTTGNSVPNCDEVTSITDDIHGGLDKILKPGTEST